MPPHSGSAAGGTTIGPYELRQLIGAGGMGEVYRAWDPRLRRDVAVKVLRVRQAEHPGRAARFLEEARSAAAVTHPNIVTIYEVATDADTPYIVSELIDGESLAEELARGALTMARAVDLAVQIADGLAEAHAAGIVHCDLKPANVMVTRSGRAKIVDFGLAEPPGHFDGPPWPRVPGAIEPADDVTVTVPGLIGGTVPYMSPEQARGGSPDVRSDQFALGLILYESLTGRRAFARDTPAATLEAIATEEPPSISSLVPRIPGPLEVIVARCLAKRPEERYHATADLFRELKTFRDRTLVAANGRARHRRLLQATAATATIAAGTVVLWLTYARATGAAAIPAAPRVVPIFAGPFEKLEPALSPDGSRLAFLWQRPEHGLEIYVTPVGVEDPVRLTYGTGGPASPVFSRDARFVLFRRNRRLADGSPVVTVNIVPSGGGPEREIVTAPHQTIGAGLDWTADDLAVIYPARETTGQPFRLRQATLATGEQRWLTAPDAGLGDRFPAVSTDGARLAFVRQTGDESAVMLLELRTGRLRTLASGGHDFRDLAWSPSGQSILATSLRGPHPERIVRIPIDGAPVQAVAGFGEGSREPSLAHGSGQLAYRQSDRDHSLMRVDVLANGTVRAESIALSSRNDTQPDLSPDGTRLAFASDRSGAAEIWIAAADGSSPSQLTDLRTNVRFPRWSPDGRQIVFSAQTGSADTPAIHVVDVQTRRVRRLTSGLTRDLWPTWSRDGATILFRSDSSGRGEIWRVAAEGGAAVRLTTGGARRSRESADGRWLFFSDGQWLRRQPSAGGPSEAVAPLSSLPSDEWIMGDGAIYYVAPKEATVGLVAFDVLSKRLRTLFEVPGAYAAGNGMAMTRDARVFVIPIREARMTIMLADGVR